MGGTILKAFAVLLPASVLLFSSGLMFGRGRDASSLLQLLGSGCFVVVALSHICEALNLLPSMGWGREHSIGHYLNLSSAALGLILFPTGYLLHALGIRWPIAIVAADRDA